MTIWHSRDGKRAGVTYAGTIAMLERADLSDTLLKSARHLHIGAYFLQSRLHADAPELFARAKALGLTTSLDCNYDPVERWDSNLRQVLQHTDLFLPNEDEALAITKASDVPTAARALSSLAQIVVIKRGASGALVAQGERQFTVPAIPVEVVDTTGAGDSFNAGFLREFLQSKSLDICAKAGIDAAARSVQVVGGTAAFEN